MTRKYQICTNCVMDTTDSKISFATNGCLRSLHDLLREDPAELAHGRAGPTQDFQSRRAERIKEDGKGRQFDCIIGMSGGIDSSYLTYIAKEQLGLRPLVFHVDAGWNSQMPSTTSRSWSTSSGSTCTPR